MPTPILSTPGISEPELVSPASGTATGTVPFLQWRVTQDDVWPGADVHFQLQVAEDAAFSIALQNLRSIVNPSGFQYESSPGVWTALPASGLPQADLGKTVRYQPSGLEMKTYYWRVSIEQIL